MTVLLASDYTILRLNLTFPGETPQTPVDDPAYPRFFFQQATQKPTLVFVLSYRNYDICNRNKNSWRLQ